MSPGSRQTPRNLRARSVLAGQASASVAEVEQALEPGIDPHVAAFFDVDNTLLRGAAVFQLARGLHRRRFFTAGDLLRGLWKQIWFQYLGGERADHIDDARGLALAFVAGHRVSELRQIGEDVFDDYLAERIWPGTKAIAQWHLDHGHRVWLVTAAPVEIAEVIAHRLGLTGALGTVAESVDGVYTGRLVGELLHGEGKATAVRALATAEGLDLDRCYAYSDSRNDLPMFSLVGHPCAVNPDAALRAHAKAEGWLIRDYRVGRRLLRRLLRTVAAALAAWIAAAIVRRALRNRR